jgi:hypothetical protein
MKNIQKPTDSLPSKEDEEDDVKFKFKRRCNCEVCKIRTWLPKGETKEIDPRYIC